MYDQELLERYRELAGDARLVELQRDLLALLRAAARAAGEDPAGQRRVSAVHTGEPDVLYFTVVTPAAAQRQSKYTVAFVPGELRFELWLCGVNRAALSRLKSAGLPLPQEERLPIPDDWQPFVAARWSLGGMELAEPGAEALARAALCRIGAVDPCLAQG